MKTIWLVKEAQNHQNGKDDDTFYWTENEGSEGVSAMPVSRSHEPMLRYAGSLLQ
jgi:hypothetical protein